MTQNSVEAQVFEILLDLGIIVEIPANRAELKRYLPKKYSDMKAEIIPV